MEHEYLELLKNNNINNETQAAILCAETTEKIYREITHYNFQRLQTGKFSYVSTIILAKNELKKEGVNVSNVCRHHLITYLDYRYKLFITEELPNYIEKSMLSYSTQ